MNIINSPAKRTLKFSTTMGLIMPQNGRVDGALHCGAIEQPLTSARATTVATTTNSACSVDSRKSTTGSSSPARPTAFPAKHELRNRGIMEEALDNSQGSLPCTPESGSDNEAEMDADTRQLLSDFFKLFTGLSQSKWKQSPALSTMKRVVENLLEKHRYAYNGMINKLSLDDRGDDVTFIGAVAKSIFEDGTTNWGRIASLIAFGAVVCQYLKTKGRENCVELVGQEISSYLLSYQRDWLVRNNAWEGFVEFFTVEDPEGSVRHALMAVAGLAGIGATLAMLIR